MYLFLTHTARINLSGRPVQKLAEIGHNRAIPAMMKVFRGVVSMKAFTEKLTVLLRILDTEQQNLQRSDSKATALLSTLGVFMVFFIVHFDKVSANVASLVLVFFYFIAAVLTIFSLLMVIRPKLVKVPREPKEEERGFQINPTFFGGISRFRTPGNYARYLADLAEDDHAVYTMFSKQLYAISKINMRKTKWLSRGMLFFITAITLELLSIISVYLDFTLS